MLNALIIFGIIEYHFFNIFLTNYRTALIGFFRFLDFITSFDWKNQFLAINFNNESLGSYFNTYHYNVNQYV